jgi:2-polyprenyl-3-methyl-5-hydroxy-6-metoxy-1,4-benzoquinol methylase
MNYYESSAFTKWCERVYGKDLKQIGMVTIEELELFYEEINLLPDSWILDIGCGLGYITAEIAEHFNSNIIGIDIDENIIFNAQKHWAENLKIKFEILDGNKINLLQSNFDLICFLDTIYFTDSIENLNLLLDKCFSILNPEGKVVIFYSSNPQMYFDERYIDYDREIKLWSNKNNMFLKTIDLTNNYRKFWINALKETITMKSELEDEIPTSYIKLINKCSCFSKLCLKGNESGMFRWMYIISKSN